MQVEGQLRILGAYALYFFRIIFNGSLFGTRWEGKIPEDDSGRKILRITINWGEGILNFLMLNRVLSNVIIKYESRVVGGQYMWWEGKVLSTEYSQT